MPFQDRVANDSVGFGRDFEIRRSCFEELLETYHVTLYLRYIFDVFLHDWTNIVREIFQVTRYELDNI